MSYHVVHADALEFEERPSPEGSAPRLAADVTVPGGLEHSRARMWRYSPRSRGRRHVDHGQEETFVVLAGTLTMLLGDPPERVDVAAGGLVAVHADTPLQVRNETDEDLVLFIYGAPPVTGEAEFLDDVESI
ncbi:MAG TPA: cupin domain-containing protein [Gaiellaceae bacterium]|nr:cupin domain-containing protein [Gaiellaceae bacterium]